MEFQYQGGNCIVINTKGARIVVDDNLVELGAKGITKPDDISLFTQVPETVPSSRLVFSDPGEYEVSDVSIVGVPARSHLDEEGSLSATIYKIQYGGLRAAVIGHIHPSITEEEVEELGAIDILFVPVGGNGYTLDPLGALSVIKKVEPKIVVPTHYDDAKLKYPMPQQPLEEALKAIGLETKETLAKFKPKPADFTDNTQLVVLERS